MTIEASSQNDEGTAFGGHAMGAVTGTRMTPGAKFAPPDDGGSGGGGDPAPAGGGEGGGQPAPAPEPNPDPAPDPAPVPDPTPAPGGQQGNWFDGFDDDDKGWIQNRGYDKLDQNGALKEAIKGHRNLEKHMGVPPDRLVRLPEDMSDPNQMGEVFDKLGRPEQGGYELKTPDGADVDQTFNEWAQSTFHELGLTKQQGEQLVQKFAEFQSNTQSQSQEQIQQQNAEADEALKKEWGQAYDQKVAIARRAATDLGVDPETLDKLDSALGYGEVIRMFNKIGEKVMEPDFADDPSSKSSGFGGKMTPEQAKARINDLKQDAGFRKRYTEGDVEAKKEMERLHQMAYPDDNQDRRVYA